MKNILNSLEKFPSKESLANKAIEIECFQVVSHYHKGDGKNYGGKGISINILKELIEWAKNHDWVKIVAYAINHIKPLLLWSGMNSIKRYISLGFKVVKEEIDPSVKEGVISQRQGYHGNNIQEMWKEYSSISNDEAARVYNIELKLK